MQWKAHSRVEKRVLLVAQIPASVRLIYNRLYFWSGGNRHDSCVIDLKAATHEPAHGERAVRSGRGGDNGIGSHLLQKGQCLTHHNGDILPLFGYGRGEQARGVSEQLLRRRLDVGGLDEEGETAMAGGRDHHRLVVIARGGDGVHGVVLVEPGGGVAPLLHAAVHGVHDVVAGAHLVEIA